MCFESFLDELTKRIDKSFMMNEREKREMKESNGEPSFSLHIQTNIRDSVGGVVLD